MIRLTLRTLLAYLDDTLPPAQSREIGEKLAASPPALELAERIKKVIRKRSVSTPASGPEGSATDANIVAAYLSDSLPPEILAEFERNATESDASLAELAACHQILTLVLSEQIRVPTTAYRRMYGLVKGRESIPTRKPNPRLPVGGVPANDRPADDADADAEYLLGLPAISRGRGGLSKLLSFLVPLFLLGGFAGSVFLLWPKGSVSVNGVTDVSAATGPAPTSVPATAPATEAKPTAPAETKPAPETKPVPTKPKPVEKPPVPAKEGRLPVAKWNGGADRVLLTKPADGTDWKRAAKGAELQSSDSILCLPGFSGKIEFESGLTAELWANVPPDLQPLPVLETSLVLYPPGEGFSADAAVIAGRVYFTTAAEAGGSIRLRLRDGVWDVSLPGPGSEIAVEMQHRISPGANPAPPTTIAVVHAMKGKANVAIDGKAGVPIDAGQVLEWSSKTGKTVGPQKPSEQFGKDSAYFSKSPVFLDDKSARAMLGKLADVADRLKPGTSLPSVLAELRTEPNGPPTAEYLAGARWSVLASGALARYDDLADSLNDAVRPDLNAAAIISLRQLFAVDPDREKDFRPIAERKLRMNEAQYKSFLRAIHGPTAEELKDEAYLFDLAEQLDAPEVAQRGAALFVLITEIDPRAAGRPGLIVPLNETKAGREAAVKAWKMRIAEVLKSKK